MLRHFDDDDDDDKPLLCYAVKHFFSILPSGLAAHY
jgi:hypothetical protein